MTRLSRSLNLTALVCCAMMLSAANAHATASLTYTASFGPELTDWSGLSTPDSQGGPSTITIPKFNGATGTLQSVLITSNDSATSNGSYSNTGGATATITGNYQVRVDLMPANSLGDSAAFSDNFTGATPILSAYPSFANVSSVSLAAGDTYSYDGTGPTDTRSTTITGPTNLAAYVGTGDLVFPLYTTVKSNLTGTNASNVTISQTTEAMVGLTVTYNYGVPEPSSILILSGALVGWAFVRRRKR